MALKSPYYANLNRCGTIPSDKPWTRSFLEQVRSQTRLDHQGDGIRSFVGCFLDGVFAPHPIVLIDEPEAFLHPRHAHILGRMLATTERENRQFFIATHSVHLLLALLESQKPHVRVVRICRDGKLNRIRELRHAEIMKVWDDPFLRASNVLEGLFHERVILCEGDADCRFYSCVLEALCSGNPQAPQPDVMFTSCGGKQRIPVVARALRALGVPVSVIVDFDIFENELHLKALVEVFGVEWSGVKERWSQVNRAIREASPPLALAQVRERISETLSNAQGPYLAEKTRKEIQDCLRTASPWSAAKRAGKAILPSGLPTTAYGGLIAELERLGVFVVECGELERFAASVAMAGGGWVSEVLRKDLATEPELEPARAFVRRAARIA